MRPGEDVTFRYAGASADHSSVYLDLLVVVTGTVVEVERERALIELEAQQEGRRIIRNARAE